MKTIRIIEKETDLMIFKFEDDGSHGSIPQTGDTVVGYEGRYKVLDREHILSTDHPYGPGELNIYVIAESEALPEPPKEDDMIDVTWGLRGRAGSIFAAYLRHKYGTNKFQVRFTKQQILETDMEVLSSQDNFGEVSQKAVKEFIADLATKK